MQAASLTGRPQASGIMSDAPTKDEKLSPVEGFKVESHYLRDPIPTELVDGNDNIGTPATGPGELEHALST